MKSALASRDVSPLLINASPPLPPGARLNEKGSRSKSEFLVKNVFLDFHLILTEENSKFLVKPIFFYFFRAPLKLCRQIVLYGPMLAAPP